LKTFKPETLPDHAARDRFIVRMNQHIDGNCVWRTGVVLKIGANTVLVKADLEDRKVAIAIDGLEHTRRDALAAIRYQLDEIHASIKGLNPQKKVPAPGALNAEALDYDYLLQLERDGFDELPVKDGNHLVKINVRQVLSGIETEASTSRLKSFGSLDGQRATGVCPSERLGHRAIEVINELQNPLSQVI
jgi:hypothetical protein